MLLGLISKPNFCPVPNQIPFHCLANNDSVLFSNPLPTPIVYLHPTYLEKFFSKVLKLSPNINFPLSINLDT